MQYALAYSILAGTAFGQRRVATELKIGPELSGDYGVERMAAYFSPQVPESAGCMPFGERLLMRRTPSFYADSGLPGPEPSEER
jgi:hypothetical protein